MSIARSCALITIVAGAFALASPGMAQSGGPLSAGRFLETRAGLEALAKSAESARHSSEAALLRARLHDGDFLEGDRVVLVYEPEIGKAVSETLTVRPSLAVEIAGYSSIPLRGVLHSELYERVLAHFSKSFTNPAVRVNPLIRLAVQGSVMRPGYVYASPDSPLSDVLMLAGGQTADADWPKTIVRRSGLVLWKASDLQQAIAQGLSVDRLQLRTGDEVFVGKKSTQNVMSWVQLGATVVTLFLALSRAR